MGIQFVKVRPGMDDMTFLGIVCTEQAVDGSIPSAFVAIAPQHDTRMVYIARQHFANKPGTRRGIVSILPACQFINIKQAQRVAGIQEMLIRRIMGTDSVHIHFFDELHVLYAKFFIRGSSTIGMERVAVDSLHNQLRTVQVEPVAGTEINGAETDAGIHKVTWIRILITQIHSKLIKVGRFRSPRANIFPTACGVQRRCAFLKLNKYDCRFFEQCILFLQRFYLYSQVPFLSNPFQIHIQFQCAIRLRVHSQTLYMCCRFCFQPYRAVYSTEQPPVRFTFGGIHCTVVGMFLHPYFYLVGTSVFQQFRYVIREAIETALMHRSRRLPVD